jgi:LuxR family maltose regulon positive regulatory protein
MEWAADLIERNVLPMINLGEVTELARWIGRLPDDITRQRPPLILAYAWVLLVTHQPDLARYWLDELRRLVDQHEKQAAAASNHDDLASIEGVEKVNWTSMQGGLALCESYLAMASGDMERAADLSQQATSYLQDEGSYYSSTYFRSIVALDESISSILSGDTQKAIESLRAATRIARQANNQFVMIIAGCALADMQALQGQLSKAWETYQRVQYWARGPGGKPLPLAGLVDMGLGEILLEHDLLEEARDYLERGVRITQSTWYIGSLHGMIALACLRQAMGDIPGTLEVIEEAAHMALGTDASEWDEVVAPVVAVRLALQRDDLAYAELWWKKGGFPELNTPIALENYPYHVFEYLLLTQAKFLLVKGQESGRAGDLKQAAEMLEILLLEAERFHRVTSQIQILVLQAMVQSALGDEGAKKTLLRALELGEPEGYRRVYLDEGWRLADLLYQCRIVQQESGSHLPSVAFIDSLLKALQRTEIGREIEQRPVEGRAGPTPARLEDGFPISLSAREMEVLALIAEGKSNQEISAELYLALNTVKRHAYNIYAKLEVKKRTQAVSKARQLGLIP